MNSDEIKRLIRWLQTRVSFQQAGKAVVLKFDEPSVDDFKAEGFDSNVIKLTLKSEWWPDMVSDIIETSDFADPDEPADQIFRYARDVVKEYINKRIL